MITKSVGVEGGGHKNVDHSISEKINVPSPPMCYGCKTFFFFLVQKTRQGFGHPQHQPPGPVPSPAHPPGSSVTNRRTHLRERNPTERIAADVGLFLKSVRA